MDSYAIVLTTINSPTPALKEIAANAHKLDAIVFVAGDQQTPINFKLANSEYFSLEAQMSSGFRLCKALPTRHYARKNAGYLAAMRHGATVIIETDDDNLPCPSFWKERLLEQTAPLIFDMQWVNIYRLYADGLIWPRGFPLDMVKAAPPDLARAPVVTSACLIQQGLVNQDPDVDAVYRLTLPLPVTFSKRGSVLIGGNTCCPLNSQNTTWWRQAFPLLYLPSYCTLRSTDIWRGLVAQRIAAANQWPIAFHDATVVHERNHHDLMNDFKDELPLYTFSKTVKRTLDALVVPSGDGEIASNLRLCYQALVDISVVAEQELALLDAWLLDLRELGVC